MPTIPEHGLGEEDTWPAAVCGNCLAIEGDPEAERPVVVTFDEWSGRRLCDECEPAPMVDGIRPGGWVRIGPGNGPRSGDTAVVVRHQGDAAVVQPIGSGVELAVRRTELTPLDDPRSGTRRVVDEARRLVEGHGSTAALGIALGQYDRGAR